MARVPYLTQEDLSADEREALDALSDEEDDGEKKDSSNQTGVRNVYHIMAHNVDLLNGFRTFGSTLWHESGLSPIERETVILATARNLDSKYEWHQHVRIAQDEGISAEEIVAISNSNTDRLTSSQAAIVEYVNDFAHGNVDEDVHELLSERFQNDEIVGIGMLCGLYIGLARLLDALNVSIEDNEEFVGWEVENTG